jgi:hypothetical protein
MTDKNIYYPQLFELKESFDLSKTKVSNINSYLTEIIKDKIGNKCIEKGYVLKDSIRIVSRSIGKVNTSHFNGLVYYNLKVEGEVCKPSDGDRLYNCKVVGINKIGIFATLGPLQIIVAAIHHEDTSFFEKIKVNDLITVEIVNYKFQLNDDNIKVVAKFIQKE